jgi:uncharacterized membrane protein
MPVTIWRRVADVLMIGLGAAMVAALVHIVLILIIPFYASHDAFARLRPLGEANETIVLERPGPLARLLPYRDPAVASAFCRFDLTAGPLRVKAPADGARFASLSFHTRRGGIFYAITDKAATRGVLEALVVTEEQLRALEAKDDEDTPVQDLRVVSTAAEGFVMMRAFSEEPSLYPRAEDDVRRLVCANESLPE